MEITLTGGEMIDTAGEGIHKYYVPQRLYKNSIFIMQDAFDREYDGYAILTTRGTWVFFWRETVAKYGEKDFKQGHFDNKPFIRVSIDYADGEALQ